MGIYLEPIYLNEKMVLNCATYMFKGVASETEDTTGRASKSKGSLTLGLSFLEKLISANVGGELGYEKTIQSKTIRRHTIGGLHMALIDSLNADGKISKTPQASPHFSEIDAILRPIDFFSIVETIKTATPLLSQLLMNFGDKILPSNLLKIFKSDHKKYEDVIQSVIKSIEDDYNKSGLLEMVMLDPKTKRQIGIVDIDLSDLDHSAVKAKLTDGRFKIIGRISRETDPGEKIGLLQRTFIPLLYRY